MSHSTSFDQFAHITHKGWLMSMSFLLRIALGSLFLTSGWIKITSESWSATNYLLQSSGPFASWFQSLAGNMFVDQLNIYGQLAIGFALLFGFLVRPASFFGSALMLLYYFAQFSQNTSHGFIEEHILYFLLFLLFCSGGFGHVWGLDGLVGRQPQLQKKRWVMWFFG